MEWEPYKAVVGVVKGCGALIGGQCKRARDRKQQAGQTVLGTNVGQEEKRKRSKEREEKMNSSTAG